MSAFCYFSVKLTVLTINLTNVKRKSLILFVIAVFLFSCSANKQPKQRVNPFFETFDTPFQVPPFDRITNTDYLPAFKKGMEEQNAEIALIVNNTEAPSFANTIEALEYSGQLLNQVGNVFFNLQGANTNDSIQAIAKEVAPLLSQHGDAIKLNEKLFARIKSVYDSKEQLDLNSEQKRLLEETYKDFVRGGANLAPDKKEELKKINEELSLLSLQFGENLLAETNNFQLIIDNKDDLAGLPESVITAAAEEAGAAGMEGKWLFSLQKPSWIPFLTYSDRRDLREKLYKAMYNRGNNDNEFDNKSIINKMVNLRLQKANLMGYNNWSAFLLDDRMAKKPENVYALLEKVWTPALKRAQEERGDMQAMIDNEGGNFKLQSWDWWYYSEKVRKAKYNLDEEQLRPYFELNQVREGAFTVANKLYGLTFTQLDNMPLYHPDCKVFEVKDKDGSEIGVLYMDFYPRASKRGGAWMTSYRKQHYSKDGKDIRPVISVVTNFSKPTGDQPALLTYDEVETLFHEFGHALHGLLSQSHYNSLSGTAVARDFVELPSQIMEHWAPQPEVLKMYARHYKTGELIPQELVNKLVKAGKFNQGFTTVEYLAASFLDMDYHTITQPQDIDVNSFQTKSMDKIGLIGEIIPRYKSTYFAHIFSGGYSSGYYSYIWAEVLDADAFEAYKEAGNIFDQTVATAFRTQILERGGTDEAMNLYVNFRGKEPGIEPLLKNRGLLD